ncbi:Ig-like domain (group 2) [Caminicella sporogenes DSM 14501]|uniref:Ig-like domain (Group 2) n=1 Tax=Caminicella sporogenes DSM 14501 TaxID=1121266 RepID=A0A1M6SBD3_9FIRM|nr:S-layer homology domain-containing protein [Caminicella sporogenes]RKD26935.1 hypothetical protein BET04_10020 [Caminicella sporogenes]SHK41848.1 Ig-like domain (group 2) [Caminicella sporogenes DSM 14501]
MKKSISILLIFAMLFSYIPILSTDFYIYGQTTVSDSVYEKSRTTAGSVYEKLANTVPELKIQSIVEENKDYEEIIDNALEKLKDYYNNKSLDYIPAMAYNHASDNLDSDLRIISDNLRVYSLKRKSKYNCYKGIMGIIASGQDPRNFEYEGETFNYVDILVDMQQETGLFDDDAQEHAYCILALDMAGADYDKDKAIKALKSKFTIKEDKAYIKGNYSPDLKKTAIAMIALSNHKNISGVKDLLRKCVNYIKSEQKDNGEFGYITNPELLGKIIQALIAVGENPLAGDYVKNGKTILDLLMEYQNSDGTYAKGTWYHRYDKISTEAVFAALSDLKKNKSMYHALKIELGDVPSKIILKVDKNEVIKGKTIKIRAKILDAQDRLVIGQKIKWTSSDNNIAVVENGVVTAKNNGKVTITAEIEGNLAIKNSINITVVDRKPTDIKIYLKDKEVNKQVIIKKGQSLRFIAKVLDQDNEEIKDVVVTWNVAKGNDYVTIDNGKVTGLEKGRAIIKAVYKSIESRIEVEVITIRDVVKDVLGEIKTVYEDKSEYDYIEALALSYMGEDKNIIKEKIKINENLYTPIDYAENIIMLIAAGLDPRNYNGHNYVEELAQSQNDKGYFEVGSSFICSKTENVILPIIALDMAGETYDVQKAIKFLEEKAKSYRDSKYFEKSSNYSRVQMTSMAIIAMSKHMDMDNVKELVEKCKTYFKYKQNDEAVFSATTMSSSYLKPNSIATASVIQALKAIGENPLSDEWKKGEKTIFDGLLSFKEGKKFKITSTSYITNDEATAYSFAALVDLYKDKSMYHEVKIETGTIPTKIEILSQRDYVKEGQKLKLRAKVTDKDGKIVPGQKIEWICSDKTKNIAVIDKMGLLVGKQVDGDKKVIITAKIRDKNIKVDKEIIIKDRVPYEIKISLPSNKKDNNLKEGQKLILFKKVLEEDGEELDEEVIWSSSDETVAVVDETGLVTAKEVEKDTKVIITATSKSKKDVKKEIVLNIIAVIPEKVVIFCDDKEIDEKTIEAGYKLKVEAKTYEKDGSFIEKAEIEWTSSNEDIAVIDSCGLITAKQVQKEADVRITAKVKGFNVSKVLNIKVIPAKSDKEKAESIISELKQFYKEDTKYDYIEALALNRVGIDKKKIQEKLDIEKLSFKRGSWGDNESGEYAKAIISIIAAGLDPRNYKNKDYVKYLADSQVESGYFDAKGYYYSDDDEADNIAYSIIALDMACAEYDIDKAVKALMDKFEVLGDKAYVKGVYKPSLEKTTISLIALSNHVDKNGVSNLINKIKKYIKEEYEHWDKNVSSIDIASIVQALIAVGENPLSETYIKKDEYGNKVTLLDRLLKFKDGNAFKEREKSSYIDKKATALVFAVLTDISTGKSMYKEIKIKVGNPEKIEIVAENEKKELKVGRKLKLFAKAYDKDNKFVPSQIFVWSVDKPSIAVVDKNTGEITAVKEGTVVITATLKDFPNIKDTFKLKILPVIPDTIKVSVDKNIKKIEVGRKIKIKSVVCDKDREIIENVKVVWTIKPKDYATIDENNILTALKEGKIYITGIVKRDEQAEIKDEIVLEVIKGKTDEEKINEAINAVKEYFKKRDKYDFITSMGLRFAGVNINDISSKKNIYSYRNLGNDAKNIINIIATGENPKDYKDKNYIDFILKATPKFYENSNAGYIAKAIIALDMAGEKYEEKEAVAALINKLKRDGDKLYVEKYSSADVEDTAWVLIALSNHKEKVNVQNVINSIKRFFKEHQKENALIERCSDTAIVIQALMAIGENPLSDEWVKYDEYGNKITLLDAILSCREGEKFKVRPSVSYTSEIATSYALAALADLAKNKSMYHELKYVKAGKPQSLKINLDSLNLLAGEEKQLEVQVFDEKNVLIKDIELIWESSKPNIVKVENGKVIALSAGESQVKAKIKEDESIFDEITVKVRESKDIDLRIKASINKLVDYYNNYGLYDYMAALALKHIEDDFKIDKEKIASNLRLYRRDYAIHYAKNIMEIIAAGKNPRNYPIKDEKGNIILYKNYVMDLVSSQRENGEFIVSEKVDEDSINGMSLSIIALDMADGSYDVEKAVNRLVDMINDGKHKKEGLYSEIETKALVITALAKHKDIKGVNETINHCIDYIKSSRNEEGGFDHSGYKNNTFAIATVIQALIANDIDPVKWVKNGKSIVEVLLERQLENGAFEYGEGVTDTPKSTETAFAALADLYRHKSMYHEIKIKDDLKEKLKKEIDFLKKAYEDNVIFDFLGVCAANLAGMDKELIQNKLFEYDKTDSAWQASKMIIAVIGAGLDPRNYETSKGECRNYVDELQSSQVKNGENKGEFILKEVDRNSIEALAYSIIALDMADGKYDREAAVKRLIQMIEYKDSKTYKEILTEALVLTALAKHKDINGVEDTIKTLIDFLKSKQNSDAGFDIEKGYLKGENSPIAIGRVIQALIANGINPLYADEWKKDNKTILDALLKSKVVKSDPRKSGYGKGEGQNYVVNDATSQAFVAIVALYSNQSIFEKLAIKYEEVEDIPEETQQPVVDVKLYVRIEGNNRTIVPKTEVKVDKLDLSDYGINRKFKKPRAIHAIIKALERQGIDCKDSKKGLNHNGGSYITMIDGLEQGSIGDKDGWMYYVDNKFVPLYVNEMEIKDEQYIVVFFQEDYTKNVYSWFDKEEVVVKTGEKFDLLLTGSYYDMYTDKTRIEPVNLAKILVNNEEYKLNEKNVLTDETGKVTLKFDKAGIYYISAERFDRKTGKRNLTRPYCKVIVEEKVIDKQPPEIIVEGIEEGQKVNESEISFAVKVKDNIDKELIPIVKLEDEKINPQIDGSYKIMLKEGENKIKIEAVDKAGNKAEKIYTIRFIKKNIIKILKDKPTEIKVKQEEKHLELPEITEEEIRDVEIKVDVENIKDATIKVQLKEEKGKKQAILPKLEIKSNIAKVEIPAGIIITAEDKKWDGTIKMPTEVEKESVKIENGIPEAVVEVGGDIGLTFNKAVRLVISGQAGKKAAYIKDGKIIEITQMLREDNQEIADKEIAEGKEGKIDVGKDLVIWTKHFTKFIAYTEKVNTNKNSSKRRKRRSSKETKVYKDEEINIKNTKEIKAEENIKDIKGHWAEKYVKELVEIGIISGYPDKTFKPEKEITRAEFITMLVKAFNLERRREKEFKDIKGHWAKEEIKLAASNGIIEGYEDGTCRPDEKITREEMAVIIAKVLKQKGYKEATLEELNIFTDKEEISVWAREAVSMCVKEKIIRGMEDGRFAPKERANRAQAAVMLYKLYNLIH